MAFGKELTKEEAAKRNYFDIFGRHFTKIVEVSLLYFCTIFLFLGASAFLFATYMQNGNLDKMILAFLNGDFFALPLLPFLPLMLTGPFTAGFTYVIRNFTKQEPTFIVSDFFEHTKKNIKQALFASVLGYFVMYLMVQALVLYNSYAVSLGISRNVVYTLFSIVSVLLIIMSFYVYPIMVTFKMTFRVILKNAWTFTVLKLPQNLIIFAFLFGIHFGLIYALIYSSNLFAIYLALMAFILTGFTSFTANYYIWHVLDKYIVRFVTPQKNEEEA